jgi:hypothetical protein
LSTTERHALGAHYTPRAYVERLVMPTVIEPLRAEWALALGAALVLAAESEALDGKKREDKLVEARAEVQRFHRRLCEVRVLDPACGSGNFLYVTLEHLKRLEGEVLDRLALGDGYTQTLRATWPEVPESADFVMYWWHQAAQQVRTGRVERFGFITTNSLRQTFNRRVIEHHLNAKEPLTLAFAVPDHPWVDSAHGAAVRIAMSVGTAAAGEGRLLTVTAERGNGQDEIDVQLDERRGVLHADLRVGANVASAQTLRANVGVSSPGVKLHGAGFIVTDEEAQALGLGTIPGLEQHIRDYRNGKDLTARPRGVKVIDLFGLDADAVRQRFPAVYQWVMARVKPERDQNNRAVYRDNWWIFGEPRRDLRPVLNDLERFIATVETSKHRHFQFLDASILPDNKLLAIGFDQGAQLGVLSSQIHVAWSLATGSWLGVGNDSVYVKSRCFETFPFPELEAASAARVSQLAEELDAFRKARQAAHESVTLTGMYNVLDKLRREEPLNAKDKALHEQALVGVLRTLHDALDAAVLGAYGWQDLGPVPWTHEEARQAWTERLLERLVDLNTRRASEEAQGTIRWLRPEFQDPARRNAAAASAPAPEQTAMELVGGANASEADDEAPAPVASSPAVRLPWPADLPEQMRAVADALAHSTQPLDEDALAGRFTGRGPWKKRLPQILETLVVLGKAQREAGGRWRGA